LLLFCDLTVLSGICSIYRDKLHLGMWLVTVLGAFVAIRSSFPAC
jgi:hypothetical protein